ncbi:hypothetical protein F4777DRAFT_24804 [Nemania sp. FL0916]|nr:hypothetical protein F4777DRAFT_24804 [Nemania sp. FL0916]
MVQMRGRRASRPHRRSGAILAHFAHTGSPTIAMAIQSARKTDPSTRFRHGDAGARALVTSSVFFLLSTAPISRAGRLVFFLSVSRRRRNKGLETSRERTSVLSVCDTRERKDCLRQGRDR